MKERFEGQNRQHLVAAMQRQEFSFGQVEIAEAFIEKGTLIELPVSATLISQHASDNDIFFLISGVVGIIVNGAQIATRKAGNHVGEMSAIEPSLPRSSTVTVLEKVVALKISSVAFMALAEKFPKILLPISKELARRLYQRNSQILVPNEAPKLFIISSSEAKKTADALRDGLEQNVFSTVWDEGVFFAGGYALEALEKQVAESDFAVAIAEPDDIVESRGVTSPTVRDNVLFELGLFMGKLTRYRAILVHPKVKNLKLPSDLQGLTVIQYDPGDDSTLHARIKPVCDDVRELVTRLGVRKFTFERGAESDAK